MTTTKCNCVVHQQIEKWEKALVIDTDEKRAAFEEMLELWENIATDRDYYEAILNGSWPSAEDQLTKALNSIKAKQQSYEIE